MVHILTKLLMEVCGLIDSYMGNVAILSNVQCPLIWSTHPDDALMDRAHRFKLGDLPVVDGPCLPSQPPVL